MRSRRNLLYAVVLVVLFESILFLVAHRLPVGFLTLAPLGFALIGSISGAYFIVKKVVPDSQKNPLEQALTDEINLINSDVPVEVQVERVDYDFRSGGVLTLDYTNSATDTQELLDEVENIAEAFAIVLADNDYPCEKLVVNILNDSGFSIGNYYIKEEWVNEYNDSGMSQPEYVEKISDSLRMEFDEAGYLIPETSATTGTKERETEAEHDKRKSTMNGSGSENDTTNDFQGRNQDERRRTSENRDVGALTEGELLSQIQTISPEKFEDFTMRLWEEQGWNVESMGTRGERVPDFVAYKNERVVENKTVVEAKLYREGNKVGVATIREFAGLIAGEFDDHTPVVVTSASYTQSARTQANNTGIQLVNGEKIVDIVREFNLEGVVEEYATPSSTDSLGDETIPSDMVPMADDFGTLRLILSAVRHGYQTKKPVKRYVERKMQRSIAKRQVDYYGNAGWSLGFLEKESTTMGGRRVRKWTLTEEGEKYLSTFESGEENEAEHLLQDSIRDVEIIKQVLAELQQRGELTRDELEEILVRETKLQSTTAARRSITVSRWLSHLPEVQRNKNQHQKYLLYDDSTQPTFNGLTLEEIFEKGESENVEFKHKLPERQLHLAKDIVAFANSGGGLIVFGVDDDSTVVGVTETDSVKDDISETVKSNVQPPIKLDMAAHMVAGKDILIVEIPSHLHEPCTVNDEYYIREGMTIRPCTYEDIRKFFDK